MNLAPSTFHIRTLGCQMNKHDSERVAGLLQSHGMTPAADVSSADVVVFMTCCVRENADDRLRGQVSSLKALKTARPGTLIAVGGCIGQRDGLGLLRVLPHVDVVFGTHNIGRLPELLARALTHSGPVVEVLQSSAGFTSDLPSSRENPWHAWVPITSGCDNHCTYCIVPYVRGPERSRPIEDVIQECTQLVEDGVVEATLLGQNVNSYGRDLYGEPRFAQVLRQVAETGLERVRFATSHPKDLSPAAIDVMASTPAVCKALHLPVQAGSNRILKSMNRHYTQESYLELVSRLYDAMPALALSTDIIVGFPGETDADFEDTLRVVREARYDQAFTFMYSPREGTPAARMNERVPPEIVQERFDRLVSEVQTQATAKNEALLGTLQRVLVEGPSKRDPAVIAGRTDGNKVVHAPVEEVGCARDLAGKLVEVEVLEAHTWFLAGRIVDP